MSNTDTKNVLARDIMNQKVITVSPDALIFDVAKIISEHSFDGVPVTDTDGLLIGLVTEYDLISCTSSINTSFLQGILSDIRKKKEEAPPLPTKAKEMSELKVSDIMNKEPLKLKEETPFEEIVAAFIAHHRVNPIPIVNDDNKVVGIVSRFDVLRPLNLIGHGLRK